MTIQEIRPYLIIEHIRGSHLFNLNTAKSDIDLGGIFKLPPEHFLELNSPAQEVSDEKHDKSYFELKKFINLACTANPTVLETLFVPKQFIKEQNWIYDELVKIRSEFITKKCYWSYSGYAYAQIKKASGKNKKVHSTEKYVNQNGVEKLKNALKNNEITREWISSRFNEHFFNFINKENIAPVSDKTNWKIMDTYLNDSDINFMMGPRRNSFCYFVEDSYNLFESMTESYIYVYMKHNMPFRPKNDVNLNNYDCSAIEHMPNMYRLYRNGKGLFNDNNIVYTSIPIEREWKDFVGIMYYNDDEFQKAKKEYEHFWEWMANRSEKRWETDWDNEKQYDAKNMMHTIRLLKEAEHIVNTGELKVYWEGSDKEFLMKIRSGILTYEELNNYSETKLAELKEAYEKCSLPAQVNMKKINDVYRNINEKYMNIANSNCIIK